MTGGFPSQSASNKESISCSDSYVVGLVQERRHSIADALEFHLSCTNALMLCPGTVWMSSLGPAANAQSHDNTCACSIAILVYLRADSRFVPSQWEMALLCNVVSHWLGASLESALYLISEQVRSSTSAGVDFVTTINIKFTEYNMWGSFSQWDEPWFQWKLNWWKPIFDCQYHGNWWPCEARDQGLQSVMKFQWLVTGRTVFGNFPDIFC